MIWLGSFAASLWAALLSYVLLIVRRSEGVGCMFNLCLAASFWSGEDLLTVLFLLGTGAYLASHHGLTHSSL